MREPHVVGWSTVQRLSLTSTGTPASGTLSCSSTARARRSLAERSVWRMAWTSLSQRAYGASKPLSEAASGVSFPERTRSASARAESLQGSGSIKRASRLEVLHHGRNDEEPRLGL